MWILKKLGDSEKIFYIISKKGSYTVGRKNGDIVIDDASISRNHCTIKIAKKDDCPFSVDTPTGIWVIDEGSKYGTFIMEKEWVKLDPKVVKKLENNAVIKFGVMENMYKVEFKPLRVCTSMMSEDEKESIRKALMLIDGRLLNDFDCKNCSLLIVNKVTLTPKVVLALIYGVPIVTPLYLLQLVKSIQNQVPKPEYKDFKPEIGELSLTANLVSLDPKDTRRELFKGKIFMVPSKKQYDNLKDIIVAAGGKIEFLRGDSNWNQLGSDNIIIMKPQAGAAIDVNTYKRNVASYKTKFGKRIIPENEIPQAIAYSSIEQFCNPKCLNFGVRRDTGEMSRGEIIEGETQNFLTELSQGTGVVPSSSQSQSDFSQSQSKLGNARKRDHSPDDTGSAKKRAVDESNSNTLDNIQFRVPAAKKQTSLLNFMSSKDKSVEKAMSSNSPISQSILKTTDNVLDDYGEMPKKPAKRKASVEERPGPARIEPTVKKSRVSTDMFAQFDEESSTSKRDTPARKYFPAQNKKQTDLIPRKDSTSNSNSSSYSYTTIEDDDVDEKWISCDRKTEPKEESDALNTTVMLLSLVSVSYTKENGGVVEPSHGLKNVKRFKKQRLLVPTNRVVPIDIIEDNDDWSGCFSKSSQIR